MRRAWLGGALALVSCNKAPPPVVLPNNDDTIIRLTKRLDEIEAKTLKIGWEKRAILAPSDTGYTLIMTDVGPMTLQIKGVSPFANGSRVKLRIGNLSSATLSGVETKMQWGPVNGRGMMQYDKAAPESTIPISQRLEAGSWTEADVDLAQIPPAQFGQLIVSDVTAKSIALTK